MLNLPVSVGPGITLLTVIPFSAANSVAKFRVKFSSAALLAAYKYTPPGVGTLAVLELVLIIRPPARICGITACVSKIGPRTLAVNELWNAAGVMALRA